METIKLKFGIHKGKQLKDVPKDYLKYLFDKGISKGKIKFYTQQLLNLPKEKYQVKVCGSLGQDGIYNVDAWNSDHAINECKRINHIQITQSYHGTEFHVVKL